MDWTHQTIVAFALTAAAGFSTVLGSAITFLARSTNRSLMAGALGFSGGVMVYVSLVEIFPKARASLAAQHGDNFASWMATAAFFGGLLLVALMDALVPSRENPHEPRAVEEIQTEPDRLRLMKLGLFTTTVISVHNFPEGAATFLANFSDAKGGVAVAVAIAIHNVPEGIAVSVPVYLATGSRRRAFWVSALSGLSEPLGALLAYGILKTLLSSSLTGVAFASVAGVMVFISLDELLPLAREFGRGHLALYSWIMGMAIMALSLLLLL